MLPLENIQAFPWRRNPNSSFYWMCGLLHPIQSTWDPHFSLRVDTIYVRRLRRDSNHQPSRLMWLLCNPIIDFITWTCRLHILFYSWFIDISSSSMQETIRFRRINYLYIIKYICMPQIHLLCVMLILVEIGTIIYWYIHCLGYIYHYTWSPIWILN